MKGLFYVVLLIVAVVMVYIYLRGKSKHPDPQVANLPTIVFDDTPDMPVGFGYKSQWFVVETENTAEVAEELHLTDVRAANWSTGLDGAYAGYYFVAPPVRGWTIVVNALMPDMTEDANESPLNVIQNLSRKYGAAYYFGTHRVVEYHAWAKAVNGEIVRAYGYLGESGETLMNEGEITPEELENHSVYTDSEVDDPVSPNEEDVLLLSKVWTIDPHMEYQNLNAGVGLVGK